MKKLIVTALAIFILISNTIGQEDKCNKTLVGVSVEIVPDNDTYELLEKDFGTREISEWNGFVTHMLVQILTEYEPEIAFIPLSESNGDHHYHFRANLTLIVIDEDDDNEHTGYWITSSLAANANCIPLRNWVLDAEAHHGMDRELKQAMKNHVAEFYPMNRKIILYEKEHPSPPRDPELKVDIKKEYISPLDKESRKTKVNAKVYDCRGKLVCHKYHGQPVYYQDYIDRLDLELGYNEGGYHVGNYMVIVTNPDCNNEGEYKLKKGIYAEKKKIRFKTCSLGGPIEDYVVEEKELIIRGLEIDVKPDRKAIKQDEQTKIVITFNETNPDGSRYPIGGKDIDVKISGVENGKVTPRNGYTTNSEGKVILDYKAGSNDEKIRVTASYQPVDYPDKVTGSGSVSVIPDNFAWTGTISLEITQTFNCDVEEQVSALSYQRTIAGDHKSTLANISIGLTDFDLPKQGTSAGAKMQYISGQVTFNMREDHTTEGNAQKTQCHNDGTGKWEWISPGSWGTTHQTMTGQAYVDIEDAGLTLLITKEMLGNKDAMDNMKQEMAKLQAKMQEAAALTESAAIETYKAEMLKLVQGDQGSSSIPIKVAINIFTGSINYPVYATYERKAFDVCSGDFDENESRSETLEMPLALPLGAEMNGLYTRDDKGNDRIEASIKDSEPYHVTFGSGICPEGIMTITGNITLERHKE
jgi:hypothetical protein